MTYGGTAEPFFKYIFVPGSAIQLRTEHGETDMSYSVFKSLVNGITSLKNRVERSYQLQPTKLSALMISKVDTSIDYNERDRRVALFWSTEVCVL